MNIYRKLGIGLVLLGAVMAITGVHFFAYRGNITPFESKLGELSFTFWLPIIIVGVVLQAIGKRR